jgi:hypothetical protein
VPELAAMPSRPEPPTGELEDSTSSEEGDAVEIAGKISRTAGRVVSAFTVTARTALMSTPSRPPWTEPAM